MKRLPSNKTNPWFFLVILVFISLLTHYTILENGFVNFDDHFVIERAFERMASTEIDLKYFSSFNLLGMPVRTLAFTWITKFLGTDPVWFHLASLLFHTASGIALFFLINRILCHLGLFSEDEKGRKYISFLTTFFFLVHPINSNAVAWATCLKEGFCALFSFLSIYYYIRGEEYGGFIKKATNHGISILLFALAVAGKPVAVVLPAIFLLFSVLRLKGLPLLERVRHLKFHILAVSGFYVAFIVLKFNFLAHYAFDQENVFSRVLSVFYALFIYARNFIAPFWLNVRYDDIIIRGFGDDVRVIVAISGLLGLVLLSVMRLKKDPVPMFGLCWFFWRWPPHRVSSK